MIEALDAISLQPPPWALQLPTSADGRGGSAAGGVGEATAGGVGAGRGGQALHVGAIGLQEMVNNDMEIDRKCVGFLILNERIERFSETDSLHIAVVRFWYELDGKRFSHTIDPMTGKPEWGMRSMQDDPDSTSWGGQNVFDVYSKAEGTALDGTRYAEW